MEDVNNFLVKHNIAILGVTETWLDNTVPDHEISIPNYHVLRRDRTTSRGGGVCVYYRYDLPLCESFFPPTTCCQEVIWLTLKVCSLLRKQAEINDLLISHDVDILCLTETWLSSSVPDEMLMFPGYRMHRRDRASCSTVRSGGGGVAILLRDYIQCKRRTDLECKTTEMITLEVKVGSGKSILVGSLYRPPRTAMLDFCESFASLSSVIDQYDVILTGDFNAYHSEWNTNDPTNADGKTLYDVLASHGLSVCNRNMGTRPTVTSNHLLDLVLANCPHLCKNVMCLAPLSDHCPVICEFTINHSKSKYKKIQVRKFDFKLLRELFSHSPLLEQIKGEVHIDFAWEAWYSHFTYIVDRGSRWEKVSTNHRGCNWFTADLRRLRKRKDRLYHRFRRDRTAAAHSAFRLVRNLYRSRVRAARDRHLDMTGRNLKSNCKVGSYVWWKRAKRMCNISSKARSIPDLKTDKESAQTPQEKVELLANHFAAQCTASKFTSNRVPEPLSSGMQQYSIPFISTADVYHSLVHLNPHVATSDSHIVVVLKVLADLLCDSLTYLYNRSIETATFPTKWKAAVVTPIYKNKGDDANPHNYRPISLLSAVSRIFEEHVAKSLKNYVQKMNLITNHQFAYMPRVSTVQQLLLLTNDMAKARDRKQRFNVVFMDFNKAFDKVDHPFLLRVLREFSSEASYHWLESYIKERSLRVRIENETSTPRAVSCGVPQGSHLGPILFLLFINSLPSVVKSSKVYMFADDVVLFHLHDGDLAEVDNIKNLEKDLAECQGWATSVQGSFSTCKTKVLSNAVQSPRVIMENAILSVESVVRHLGVTIRADLKFSDHFSNIKRSFVQRVNLLCYMGKHLPSKAILTLYKSYVRPAIEYAIMAWFTRLTELERSILDVLQAKVCRRYLRSRKIHFDKHESKENLNILCCLESLQYRRQFLSLIQFFKIVHNHPDYLHSAGLSVSSSVRRPNKICFNSHGTTQSTLFFHRIGKLWNCLPPKVTSITSLVQFKRHLRVLTYKYNASCKGIPDI